ncbi:hypothetical protein FRC08_010514 [Ceratobasidium sp. 394]|nr:hypothetical protein FRC08_010514 [Ceratobasidium sp. 394]
MAARLGVDMHKPPSKTQTASAPPLHTSESAKKRKAEAQARGNATQPDPLPPSKQQNNGPNWMLDRTYTELEDEEDCREWLYQALELCNPKINYRQRLDLGVEELEEIFHDKAADDEADRLNSGIRVGPAKVLKKAHKAKRLTVQLDPPKLDEPTSRPTHAHRKPEPGPASSGRIPPPASAPRPSTRQSQKPAPTANAPRSSAKFLKAQVKQLHRNGSSGRRSLATNQNSVGDRHNTPTTSKPANPLHAHPPNVPKPARHANVSQVTTANAPTRASLSPGPPNRERVGTPDVLPTTNAETKEAPTTEPKKTTKKAMAQL